MKDKEKCNFRMTVGGLKHHIKDLNDYYILSIQDNALMLATNSIDQIFSSTIGSMYNITSLNNEGIRAHNEQIFLNEIKESHIKNQQIKKEQLIPVTSSVLYKLASISEGVFQLDHDRLEHVLTTYIKYDLDFNLMIAIDYLNKNKNKNGLEL